MDLDARGMDEPPAIDPDVLVAHFERVMARCGATVPFERFEAASVQSDGLRLHLDVIPAAAGSSTLVFVPGTSVYGLVFGDFLAAVADGGVHVVSVDPRGHGRSEGVRGRYTLPELVADARAAVGYARRRFGGPIFAAGSSQGGIVAFYLAATNEPLAGVICHNLADLGGPGRHRMTAHPVLARLASPAVRALGALFPHTSISISRYLDLLSTRGNEQHLEVRQRLESDPLALRRIYLRSLASLAYCPLPRPVEQITTPVLALHGGDDRIFPRDYVEHLVGRLTGHKALRVYEGRDHFLLTEQPGRVVPDILDWIHERGG